MNRTHPTTSPLHLLAHPHTSVHIFLTRVIPSLRVLLRQLIPTVDILACCDLFHARVSEGEVKAYTTNQFLNLHRLHASYVCLSPPYDLPSLRCLLLTSP